MLKQAEQFKEEDKKRRELVDLDWCFKDNYLTFMEYNNKNIFFL
jgi:hypothetical protein